MQCWYLQRRTVEATFVMRINWAGGEKYAGWITRHGINADANYGNQRRQTRTRAIEHKHSSRHDYNCIYGTAGTDVTANKHCSPLLFAPIMRSRTAFARPVDTLPGAGWRHRAICACANSSSAVTSGLTRFRLTFEQRCYALPWLRGLSTMN